MINAASPDLLLVILPALGYRVPLATTWWASLFRQPGAIIGNLLSNAAITVRH